MCVFVCVCVREREGDRVRERGRVCVRKREGTTFPDDMASGRSTRCFIRANFRPHDEILDLDKFTLSKFTKFGVLSKFT